MTAIVIFFHSVICIMLMMIILMQSGRGGGLTESFASAESLFGAKTNSFLVKSTTVLASFFLITCLSLAILSTKRDQSIMRKRALPLASHSQEEKAKDMDKPVEGMTTNAYNHTK